MPIQWTEEIGFITIHITGKLAKDDYAQFGPAFDRLVQQHGKLRVLFDMTGFHSWDAGAAWEDIKFDMKHYGDIERLSIVGDEKWHKGLAIFFKPFTRAASRYFDDTAMDEALTWLREPLEL